MNITYKDVFRLAVSNGYSMFFDDLLEHVAYVTARTGVIELSLIQKWLRDTHEIYVQVTPYNGCSIYGRNFDTEIKWISVKNKTGEEESIKFSTYEQALTEGIYQAIKTITP
jgi:predicted transcriptional regulator